MRAARFLAVSLVLVAAAAVRTDGQQSPDASPLVAAARLALGGEAALSAITSFSVTGTMMQMRGPNASNSVDIKCVLPDRFLRVLHQTMDTGPLGSFSVTRYDGFNRDDPIQDVVAPQAPVPVVIPAGPPPRTPEGDRRRQVAAGDRRQADIRGAHAAALRGVVRRLSAEFRGGRPGDPAVGPNGRPRRERCGRVYVATASGRQDPSSRQAGVDGQADRDPFDDFDRDRSPAARALVVRDGRLDFRRRSTTAGMAEFPGR